MEKKILFVEDDKDIRDILETAFLEEGYSVVSFETGEEALEILNKENIQVMFLDMKLPGMNGLELCKEIRKISPVACIYAVTGYSSLFELVDCREAGFDDYFVKPVKMELLLHAADEAFKRLERWKRRP